MLPAFLSDFCNTTLDLTCCTIYGTPIGMPVCRSIKGYRDLWEVRSHISNGRIARVIFHISGGEMILLHGFIKKAQQTPQQDLELADRRRREYESHA